METKHEARASSMTGVESKGGEVRVSIFVMRHSAIFAVLLLFQPAVAFAQRHAVPAPGSTVSVRPVPAATQAPGSMTRPAPSSQVIRIRPATNGRAGENIVITINNNVGSQNAVVPADFVPVPGLGFDVVHLAATRGPAAVGALAMQGRFVTPVGLAGGEFFLSGAAAAPTVVVQVPPIVIEQPAAVTAPPTEQIIEDAVARAMQRSGAPAAVEQPAPAAAREASEFIFVRRDGGVFFAVAYAWENGVLRYVTADGVRKTARREILDLEATQQFNEQRGLVFRKPA